MVDIYLYIFKGENTMAKESKKYDAEDIRVLRGLEPVRTRAGMYIGNTGRQGLNHLVQEIIDNAVDEHLAGFVTEIYVSINEDGSATVIDNGRGIPVDIHKEEKIPAERVVFTVLHSGGKFNKSAYKISGGLHGVGSAVVNALSEKLFVDVYRDGYVHHDSYERGEPTTDLVKGCLPKEKLKEKKTGTSVTLYPDGTIFEVTKFKASAIRQRLRETAFLNPNLTIVYENKRDGKEGEVFHFEKGLQAFIEELSLEYSKISPIVSIKGEKDGIGADIVFVMTEDGNENTYGFTNNISNADGGNHIIGFENGFTNLINRYARNELGVLKEKDKNLRGADIRNGMIAVVSLKHPDPEFEGQTKTKIGNSDVIKVVESIVSEQLTLYFDRNYEVLKEIVDRAVAITKKRANEKSKVNVGKFSFEGNGKLSKQESNKPEECEIFIVEGDSAGGTAKTARNRKTQAILPLRGKILNVEKQPINKILENEEIKAMINAFGCGFMQDCGKDFDISKLNYHKIIIMTDADVDGSHITTLLLTLFYRCFPQLIKEGHIYIATPPLYRAGSGKNAVYLYSDAELEEYRKHHKAGFPLQRYKGLGEMDADQLWETTMNPESRILKRVSIDNKVQADEITQILMGIEVAPRKAYIEEHGQEAVLDV